MSDPSFPQGREFDTDGLGPYMQVMAAYEGRVEAAERLVELVKALDDVYEPAGVGTWWRKWLEQDTDGRRRMETLIVTLADGGIL